MDANSYAADVSFLMTCRLDSTEGPNARACEVIRGDAIVVAFKGRARGMRERPPTRGSACRTCMAEAGVRGDVPRPPPMKV